MIRAFAYSFVILIAGPISILIFAEFFGPGSGSSKPMRVKADIQAISSALRIYLDTTGDYPTTNEGLMALVERPEALPAERKWTQLSSRIPTDPWENEYRYRRLTDDDSHRYFELRSVGPDGIEGNEDDRSSLAR